MTDDHCPDCELPVALHEEMARELSAGALGEAARARLVADALERAADEEIDEEIDPPAAAPSHWLMAVAALLAIAVVIGVWSVPGEEPAPALPSIEDERRANQRLLNAPETQARLAALQEGTYVAIVDGVTFSTDANLGRLLARIDRKHPHARHRFVFAAGSQGDVAYETLMSTPPFVGSVFINAMDLGVGAGGGAWTFFRGVDLDPKKKGERPRGKGKTMKRPDPSLPLRVGPPGSGAALSFVARYSTGSTAPIVLEEGIALPRFEIPGRATLTSAGTPSDYRRYLVVVSLPELGIDREPLEAIGQRVDLEAPEGGVELGDRRFESFSPGTLAASRAKGRPVLVAEISDWVQRFPGNPFADLDDLDDLADAPELLDRFERLWKPRRAATAALVIYEPDGSTRGRLEVTGSTTAEKIRAFLAE